jgi:release factor glutamine methyltransferase
VAYLVGGREFFGLDLRVTPAVLIPRPETELLVELALAELARVPRGRTPRVLDLATGSGAVAIAIAVHAPRAHVFASDLSTQALAIAVDNAACRRARVDFRHGDWFAPFAGESFALVVANPPYVAASDPHLAEGDLVHEPRLALVAGDDGLEAIRAIVAQADAHLEDGALLLLEHGQAQAEAIRELLSSAGFAEVATWRDLAGHERVSGGRWRCPGRRAPCR